MSATGAAPPAVVARVTPVAAAVALTPSAAQVSTVASVSNTQQQPLDALKLGVSRTLTIPAVLLATESRKPTSIFTSVIAFILYRTDITAL